jgi:hypothetical protein
MRKSTRFSLAAIDFTMWLQSLQEGKPMPLEEIQERIETMLAHTDRVVRIDELRRVVALPESLRARHVQQRLDSNADSNPGELPRQ